jgi:SAM-dependent methyltransferase
MKKEVAEFDKEVYLKIRQNVSDFIAQQAVLLDQDNMLILDIAPQIHAGAKAFFKKSSIKTADIDTQSGADYIIDICQNNSTVIKDESFDIIVCTEVLEHTLQPFDAIKELHRILKKGGTLLLSTPFNFRIHGPLPDCWRFTEHGLLSMLKDFEKITINALEDENRFLMPLHYTTVAIK